MCVNSGKNGPFGKQTENSPKVKTTSQEEAEVRGGRNTIKKLKKEQVR